MVTYEYVIEHLNYINSYIYKLYIYSDIDICLYYLHNVGDIGHPQAQCSQAYFKAT